MKAVILAGGKGTRIMEESITKPKPMIEIGGKPILWHIMKTYSSHGINDFVICLGHRGYMIKEYFSNYFLHQSDVTIDIANNKIEVHQNKAEPWKITLVDTGQDTMTGGRVLRTRPYLKDEDHFCLTYGDGVGNVDITKLVNFHKKMDTIGTVTAVKPPGRFGALNIEKDKVVCFEEKPLGDGGLINGGFFVLKNKVFDYIKDDTTVWEREPLERLASEKQLSVFKHNKFWQPMDTLREKNYLEDLWQTGDAPWKTW